MKKILFAFIVLFLCNDIYAQNGVDKTASNKKKTKKLESVIPSDRSKKYLRSLQEKYYTPYVVSSYLACDGKDIGKRSKKRYEGITFADVNYAFSIAPQHSLGFTIGHVNNIGFYVSAMTGFSFIGFNTDMDCDEMGMIDGEMQLYTGNESRSRLSLIGGLMFRISDPIALKIGAGYGTRILAWETGDGKWFRNTGYSSTGYDLNVGANVFLEKINFSLDMVTTNLNTLEIKIGLGVNF